MKRILVLCAAAMLFAAPAFAAGKMEQVNQNIDVSGASITTNASSLGAGGSVGIKNIVDIEGAKLPGEIVIGKINNNGGQIKGLTQKINGSGAQITSNGAAITIGEINNSGNK